MICALTQADMNRDGHLDYKEFTDELAPKQRHVRVGEDGVEDDGEEAGAGALIVWQNANGAGEGLQQPTPCPSKHTRGVVPGNMPSLCPSPSPRWRQACTWVAYKTLGVARIDVWCWQCGRSVYKTRPVSCNHGRL